MITIDFSKCAIFEHYIYCQNKEWRFSCFTALIPYEGNWLVMDFDYDQIDWDNPIFRTEDIDYFLDYENSHLIRFLPKELAKKFINIWLDRCDYWRQSSFPKAKHIANRLRKKEEERYKALWYGNEECNNWHC